MRNIELGLSLDLSQENPEEKRELNRIRRVCRKERFINRFITYTGIREYLGQRASLITTNPITAERIIGLTQAPVRGRDLFPTPTEYAQDQLIELAKQEYQDAKRFGDRFLFLTGNAGLVDLAVRNQVPVIKYSPLNDLRPYSELNSIMQSELPIARDKDEREMKIETKQDVDELQEQILDLSIEMQMRELEARPFLVDEVRILRDGCSLYLVPPANFSRKPRWDIILESPDGILFHLTNGKAFLPQDIARRFYSRIGSEKSFDLVREQYWETLRRFAKK